MSEEIIGGAGSVLGAAPTEPAQQGDGQGQVQPAADTTPGADQTQPAIQAAQQAPETYAPFEVEGAAPLGEQGHAEFAQLARSMNLTQAQAQTLVEFAARHTANETAQMEDVWRKQVEADPEISRDIRYGRSVVKKFGNEGFMNLINQTGIGSHPDFVKVFVAIGRELGEDSFAGGEPEGGSGELKTLSGISRTVYPNFN
jgi:hypothetical protein